MNNGTLAAAVETDAVAAPGMRTVGAGETKTKNVRVSRTAARGRVVRETKATPTTEALSTRTATGAGHSGRLQQWLPAQQHAGASGKTAASIGSAGANALASTTKMMPKRRNMPS